MGSFGVIGQELDWEGEWMCSTGPGIMFAASICYVFKRLTFQDWTIFNERYAQNKVLGQTNASADSPQGKAMAEIVGSTMPTAGSSYTIRSPAKSRPSSCLDPRAA